MGEISEKVGTAFLVMATMGIFALNQRGDNNSGTLSPTTDTTKTKFTKADLKLFKQAYPYGCDITKTEENPVFVAAENIVVTEDDTLFNVNKQSLKAHSSLLKMGKENVVGKDTDYVLSKNSLGSYIVIPRQR